MVRKRRTELPSEGQSSGPQETGAGRGAGGQQQTQSQYQPPQHPQQPLPQQGGYQAGGGRGWTPQRGGYAGRGGGGAPRGGMAPQQYGAPPEYQQARGPPEHQQGRGPSQYHRGGAPQRRGGPRGPPSGGPTRPPVPELHQATQAPYQAGVTTQTVPYGGSADSQGEASSSSRAPDPASQVVTPQFQQISLQPEAPSQAIQPASSKSMRFPLRPGKGSTGTKCIVKANHFFAELPDKDLHQYDVSFLSL